MGEGASIPYRRGEGGLRPLGCGRGGFSFLPTGNQGHLFLVYFRFLHLRSSAALEKVVNSSHAFGFIVCHEDSLYASKQLLHALGEAMAPLLVFIGPKSWPDCRSL